MLGWQQKTLWCSHIFLHSLIFWIENALYPLICDIFIQIWQFHPFFEKFGCWFGFFILFCVFLFSSLGATSSFLVQLGCKLPKKNSLGRNALLNLIPASNCTISSIELSWGTRSIHPRSSLYSRVR
jgi:hypothetical protein